MELPYDRFLNLVQYALMLTLSEEDQQSVARELAAPSGVGVQREEGAPDWWLGDDEASASMMAAAQAVRSSG